MPGEIFKIVDLNENDIVELKVEDGKIIIKPAKKHRSLKERRAEYKGDYILHEWDTGISVGKEIGG